MKITPHERQRRPAMSRSFPSGAPQRVARARQRLNVPEPRGRIRSVAVDRRFGENDVCSLFPLPAWKRCADLACVIATLPISIPLLLLVACWIRLVSRGPSLFRQERIGYGGRPFVLYKFRSMHLGAATSGHQAHVEQLVESGRPLVKLDCLGDHRLIPGAWFLRVSGLDELPQLLNVLLGEMSLVGPRPCLPGEFGLFSMTQRSRFSVLPGMTGLWQVSGKNRTTFEEMVALDIDYAVRLSPFLDLSIVLRTPLALLCQISDCRRWRRGHSNRLRSGGKVPDPRSVAGTQRIGDRS